MKLYEMIEAARVAQRYELPESKKYSDMVESYGASLVSNGISINP